MAKESRWHESFDPQQPPTISFPTRAPTVSRVSSSFLRVGVLQSGLEERFLERDGRARYIRSFLEFRAVFSGSPTLIGLVRVLFASESFAR